jgi:hypothetical protein
MHGTHTSYWPTLSPQYHRYIKPHSWEHKAYILHLKPCRQGNMHSNEATRHCYEYRLGASTTINGHRYGSSLRRECSTNMEFCSVLQTATALLLSSVCSLDAPDQMPVDLEKTFIFATQLPPRVSVPMLHLHNLLAVLSCISQELMMAGVHGRVRGKESTSNS